MYISCFLGVVIPMVLEFHAVTLNIIKEESMKILVLGGAKNQKGCGKTGVALTTAAQDGLWGKSHSYRIRHHSYG